MRNLPLRAGVSGCGGISGLALGAARKSPDFEVVVLQDPFGEALEKVGSRHGIARRHRDFGDLLTDDVDFVILNGPNHVHLEQVRAAAAAGKHCLVQKPMARDAAEAAAMVDAARAHGVRLGVVMFELGKPLHYEIREMVRSGWFGDVVLVQAVAAHDLYLDTPPPEGNWRRDAGKVGGGAFIQLAVHQVNLVCWLLECSAESVFATGTRGHTVFDDETTLTTLNFTNGVQGQFAASYATDQWGFEILGTRGRCRVSAEHVVLKGRERFSGGILGYESPDEEAAIPMAALAVAIAARAEAVEVHAAFARWIAGGPEYPCPGEHGLRDMRIVDAVYRSANARRSTVIPIRK